MKYRLRRAGMLPVVLVMLALAWTSVEQRAGYPPDTVVQAVEQDHMSDVPEDYDIMDSGGPLIPEQAAYDVSYYDLDLLISPSDSSIQGGVTVHAEAVSPLRTFVLDLDSVFTVERVMLIEWDEDGYGGDHGFPDFEFRDGLLQVELPQTRQPGEHFAVEVQYHGRPRIAPNPPWQGGFTWARTENDEPWIGVSCQLHGANIWWPVKDHPSDRPDSLSASFTVPDHLTAVSNGRLRNTREHENGLKTYDWFVSTPISNYNVTVNVGPYEQIDRAFESITGTTFPVRFWALPENRDRAELLLEQVKDQIDYLEQVIGPYPFSKDKYGVVEAPFLGMEHQTLIAYGAGYQDDVLFPTSASGFDDLHQHELAHEWWGNLVTAYDWKDFWLHEGFGTYMQPLYAEYLHDTKHYHNYMQLMLRQIANRRPVAPRESRTTGQMYGNSDIYYKGAWVLHTLRYLLGDHTFFTSLRRMAYPEGWTSGEHPGGAMRYATTDDFKQIAEDVSGRELGWFFEVYLRQAALPELQVERRDEVLELSWQAPGVEAFPMPVEVQIDGEVQRVHVPQEGATVPLAGDEEVEIDPDSWILRQALFE